MCRLEGIFHATVDVFHNQRWWQKSVLIAPLRSSGVAGTKTPQLVIPRFPLFSGPGLHLEYENLEQSPKLDES